MVAWFGDPVIGGMITAAMVVNLLFADLAGTFIPLALDFFLVVIRPSAGPIFFDDSHGCGWIFSFFGLAARVLL